MLGNYNVTYKTATFTIDKKTASVTPRRPARPTAPPTRPHRHPLRLPRRRRRHRELQPHRGRAVPAPYIISATLTPAGVLGNYEITAPTAGFDIAKAEAVISVTPYSVTYNGTAHTATGTATGAAGENLNGLLVLGGTTHTNAGSYSTDSWSFPGDGNHNAASGTVSDNIAKANATIVVTGYTGVYDAAAHGASGTATGVGGAALSGLSLGASFTNVPGGTSHWTFSNANYNDQGDDVAITIGKATAAVVPSGLSQTYTGSPLTPTATTTPAGLTIGWTGAPQTNAASYAVTATVNDSNYQGSASGSFVIGKATATVTVNGYTGVYDAAAHGASGTATGVGSVPLSGLSLGASFSNVPGGTASWTFTDVTGNYSNAAGTAAIVISKANATIVVTPYSVTYNGAAHTATGTATGAGGANLSGLLVLSGTTHTNAGTTTDTWTFPGDVISTTSRPARSATASSRRRQRWC